MKKHNKLLAMGTAAVLVCSMLTGCGGAASSTAPASSTVSSAASEAAATEVGDKTLKLYVAGFQNLDPQIWSWGTHVDRMGIFEGLTQLNSDFTTRLANAESLEHNDDCTVWTAKLREDLKWSDGTALTANDYYYSLQRVIDPQYLQGKSTAFNTNAPIKNALECQKGECTFEDVGIKVLDDYTIEFTLEPACTDFDVRLAESWALPVPQAAIEKYADDWTKPANIVVNGPYIPTAREEDVHLTLSANENYYETPALETIEIYAGTQNQLLAYQNDDINVATITAADIDAVNKDSELAAQMTTVNTSVVTYIGLLKSSNDVLQSTPELRQAISAAVDRETIATSVDKGTVTAAESLVFPGFASWANDLDVVKYDADKAASLMEAAGYANGEGLDEMTCLVAGTPNADVLAVVDMIQRATGIKLKIVNEEWAAFVQDRDKYHDNDGVYGIYIDAWNTSVANTAGAFANYQFDIRTGNLSTDGLKAFTSANKVVADEEKARQTCTNENAIAYAEKYEALLKESDAAKIDAGYKELETMRLEDCSNIPLWWGNSVLLIRPTIEGYEGNPLLLNSPPFYFKDITNG